MSNYRCSLPGLAGFMVFSREDPAITPSGASSVAEGVGFEPTVRCRTLAFQASTFVHSVIPPIHTVARFSPKGGEGGIRTHGGREPTAVFKTAALNHSATCPWRAS